MILSRQNFDLILIWREFDFDKIWLTEEHKFSSENLHIRRLSATNLLETNMKGIDDIIETVL